MNRTHIGLGIFVLGTLGLLIWLAQTIGAVGSGGGDRYHVRLDHAAGLVENNAIKIAGVNVGRVERIEVDHDVAVLTLLVAVEIVQRCDAKAIVRAKSLLGAKYLQIEPGTRDGPVLEPGETITEVGTAFEVDQVLNALEPILGGEDSIAAVLGPLAEKLAELLDDMTGKTGKPPIITREEIDQLVDDVKATSASARRIVEGNENDITAIIKATRVLVEDPRLSRTLGHVDSLAATADERLPQLLDRTETALAKLEKLAEIVDEPRAKKLGTIIDDAAVAVANARKLSADLKDVGKKIDPLLDDLSVLAKRATAIDGELLRKFLQKEGVKVYFGSKREAEKALP